MTKKIRVGLVTLAFFYVPYWAAKKKGWYADRGLDVDLQVLGGIENITKQLKAGDIEIGVGSPEHVIHDVEKGGDMRMIGGNVNRLTHSLIVQKGIEKLTDLRGKKIGVASLTAGTSSLFMGILDNLGLHYPDDYSVVQVGAVPPRHELLLSGGIDAGMQTDPHNYMAEDAGLTNLGPLSQWIPEFQFNSINVLARWAGSHADTVTKFLEATLQGSRFMFEDRKGAVDIAEEFMKLPRRYLERSWEEHVTGAVPLDLHLSRIGIETAMEMMRRDRSGTFNISDASRPEDYVDASYLIDAQRNFGIQKNILA